MHCVVKISRREEFYKKRVKTKFCHFKTRRFNFYQKFFINAQYLVQIIFMKQLLKNRVRTKSSQTLQGLCAYSEVYYDYDGILTHCLPSNPWITDDTTMWDVGAPLVDQPTQLRVKKWSFGFKELLSDPTGVREFMKYCETEFSVESLKFYLACQAVKSVSTSELVTLVHKIYKLVFYFDVDCLI
jgi:hypothetical protein